MVTSRGWWDLADSDLFYPDDLPKDWQLSYFANSFRAALLPAEFWASAAPETVTQWHDDVPPGFRFAAERAGPLPPGNVQQLTPTALIQLLGPRLDGWLEPIANASAGAGATATTRCLRYEHPTNQASNVQRSAYGLLASTELLSDLRRAKDWLNRTTDGQGQAPKLIVLTRPSSSQLTAWQELLELLGLG